MSIWEGPLPIWGVGSYSTGGLFDYSTLRVGAFSRGCLIEALRYFNFFASDEMNKSNEKIPQRLSVCIHLKVRHRSATLSGETRRNFKGVCQKLNTEFPDFALAFFYFFPDSPSKFKKISCSNYPLNIRNFWNSSKFWSFFSHCCSQKRFPDIPRLLTNFPDFSRDTVNSPNFPWHPWLGRQPEFVGRKWRIFHQWRKFRPRENFGYQNVLHKRYLRA